MHKIKKIKKQAMTLLEIMIVIFIIGIIGSVIGYNMKGSLEEGKAFKSKEGSRQIYEILTLEMAKGKDIDNVIGKKAESALKNSGMVKNVNELLKDGWGAAYQITVGNKDTQEIKVLSTNYNKYLDKKKKLKDKPFWMDEDATD